MFERYTKDVSSYKNFVYITKMISKASPHRFFINITRKSLAGIYNVIFRVYLIQYIFSCLEQKTLFSTMAWTITWITLGYLLVHTFSVWHEYYQTKDNVRIFRYINTKIMDKAKNVPLHLFENPRFYDLYSKVIDHTKENVDQIIYYIGDLVEQSVTVVALIVYMVWSDPVILLFSLLPIINTMIVNKYRGHLYFARDNEVTKYDRILGYCKRIFYEKKYANEVRLYPIGGVFLKKYKENSEKKADIEWQYNKKLSCLESWGAFVSEVLTVVLCLMYATYEILVNKRLSIGVYVSLTASIKMMSFSVEMVTYFWAELNDYCAKNDHLRKFLETDYEEMEKGYIEDIPEFLQLHLKNVSFAYDGAVREALKDITLSIHKGEKIALVGRNGAGKTTLVKLIMGLYRATFGEITYNGININDFVQKNYRERFGTIFQDFQLYGLPIANNIMMQEKITDEDQNTMAEALKQVDLWDKVSHLKQGLFTNVTKEFESDGCVFSGGEAQKIALSRAFARKDAGLYIFDEPSSALDPISEYQLYQSMMKISKDKTVIFISHRLSSTRIADKIYYMEDGSIAEQGTHEELIKKNGKYAYMFQLQAQSYLDQDLEVE